MATSSKEGKPHAIVVISCGIFDKKLVIGVCQMKTSLKNILQNSQVSVVTKFNGYYFGIDGEAEIYSSGKYFDAVLERNPNPLPKQALIVKIKEVFDLDKVKKIF